MRKLSSKTPARILSGMRVFCMLILATALSNLSIQAQCNNTSSYGSATINTAGTIVTISSCSFAGEYSTISGAVSGQTLKFTSSITTDYITIRSGSAGGPVVAFGPTPLSFANTFTGTLYAHWNSDIACASQSACRTTTVQCTSCGTPAGCTNTSGFGSVTAPGPGITVTITSCQFGGEYSTINSATAATSYTVTGTGGTGNYITIHQGTSGGPIIASGLSPLTWTSTVAGTYYSHLNTDAACGTDASCHTVTITNNTAAGPCASITTIACAAPATATLAGAGVWSPGSCGFSTPGNEKIYSFTPTVTGVHSIQVTATSATGYVDYMYKAASDGCSATGWTCIQDIFSPTTVSMGTLTAGVEYYILLDGESTTSTTHTFQINCPCGTATISYAGSPYCSNAGTATVTQTGTAGGTYSAAPAGLTINAGSGEVTLGTSTPGTYTVTYTYSGGTCTTTTSITVAAPASATIAYAGSPYCSNAGTANVTQTGTAGGTYSSTAGLTLNAATGAVTLGTSTAGTYTVTYTIAAAGGCPAFTTTGTITVSPTPNAVATPASQTVCSGNPITTIVNSGAVPGTVFNWTRDMPAVTGIAASGTGNISGTLNNVTAAPITVTFTITPQVASTPSPGFNETFNTVVPLPAGWASQNLSSPVGSTGWFQGNTAVFTGNTAPGYIGANFNNTTGANTISNWLFTPNVTLKNGDQFSFWTRTASPPSFGDRLQVRMSTNGASVNAGATNVSVGDFTTLLLEINPTQAGAGYPGAWTQYTTTLSGLPGAGVSGRFAFRYFVTNGGPSGANSNYIGIDDVVYTPVPAGPTCTGTPITATVTVTPIPSATISYAGSPYCSTALTAPVTQTGTAGGTYSAAPAGLTINATTGTVTPNTSTAGTYTVTYTVAASGGCPVYTTTTSITITLAPNAIISYNGSPYCQNGGTATVTRTGSAGGTYSAAPAGLTINAATGTVTLGSSTPGTYTVTYTMLAAGCGVTITTTTITVTATPAATISYAGSPYCSNAGTANVTRTGSAGGTYSATPAGLTLNTTTGAVTLGSSTPGTYTVTYTIAAAGGCAQFTTTTTITITALPAATISYAGNPYCQNAGTANVTRTGTAGGTYSATPAGLSINATTGAVTLATSTAGTYTVSYLMAAASGCPAVTAITSITITTLPAATIAYAGSPYCQNAGTATVTITGTAGGTYTASPAGLSINAATGAVTLGTSTPGTYTVSYTLAAGGGCPAVVATATITVSSLSTAATAANASATTLCGPGNVTLTVTGGSLGTGSSWKWYSGSCGGTAVGTGASINVSVSVTTTYFVRAEGTCNTTTCTSVTVTVNVQPTISIASAASLMPGVTATLTATVTPTGTPIVWYRNGIIVPGATATTLLVNSGQLGVYTARATTALSCTALSNAITIDATPSNRLFITPNPNHGQFVVRYYTSANSLGFLRHVVLYNEGGQLVYDKTFPITAPYSDMSVDARHLAKGTYIVMLTDFNGKTLATGKVLIQ